MNIIEREIQKRQEIVDAKEEKIARIEELNLLIAQLQAEVDATDTAVLEEEIAELYEFLPQHEVEAVEGETEEVVATEAV